MNRGPKKESFPVGPRKSRISDKYARRPNTLALSVMYSEGVLEQGKEPKMKLMG